MKSRDKLPRVGNIKYLKPASGDVLSVNTAAFISGSAIDVNAAVVTWSQSGSYIKANIGTSSVACSSAGDLCGYLFWDTGYKVHDEPIIYLDFDCSGSLHLLDAAKAQLPIFLMGVVAASASTGIPPVLAGSSANAAWTKPVTAARWLAYAMGQSGYEGVDVDVNRNDVNFGWSSEKRTGDGCRGWRGTLSCRFIIRADNKDGGGGSGFVGRTETITNTPWDDCGGDNVYKLSMNTTNDRISSNATIYIYVGVGNVGTGGSATDFAAIVKSRIK